MNTNEISQACLKAFKNLVAALEIGERLPKYVFRGDWVNFCLFDSDWMFEAPFVERVSSMLAIEGASCACLVNLDREPSGDVAKFVIDNRTTCEAYQDRLRGNGPGDGWIYEIDRFGCVSDKGSWCIYCERPSELAIIGFRQSVSYDKYKPVLELLHAGRVASVVVGHADYELPSHAISAKWKEEILRHYG